MLELLPELRQAPWRGAEHDDGTRPRRRARERGELDQIELWSEIVGENGVLVGLGGM
jgi:hypothetical protein